MMTVLSRWQARASAVVLVAGLSACAGAPTELQLTMNSGQRLNPDVTGMSMPVQVHVYLLKSTARLDGADYFQLSDPDKHVLGDDVVSSQETVLRPGTATTLKFKLTDEAKFVGVVAGFQKIDSATWRGSLAVPETGKAVASLSDDSVVLQKTN